MAEKIKNFLIFGSFFVVIVVTFLSFLKIATSFAPDFSVFYYGAKDLINRQNPYQNLRLFTGVGYPPVTLLFFLPLTVIAYPIAQLVWLGLSFLSLLGAVYLSLKICLGRFSWKLFGIILALALLAFPTKFTFGMGQSNLVALFLLLLAFYLFENKKNILAGISLGLVCFIKPILIFFFFFFFLRRAWTVLSTAFFTLIVFLLISFLIVNPALYLFYINEVIPPLFNLSGREIYYNQGTMGFLSRQITDLIWRRNINFLLSFLLIGATFWIVYKTRKIKDGFALFFPTVLLIDTLSWQHHFVWLIFPFINVYSHLLKTKLFFLNLILFFSYFLVAINFKDPLLVSERFHSIFLSHAFFGTLILWGLCLYISRRNNENT